MKQRKTHFGISKGLCGNHQSGRTKGVGSVTCKTCLKTLYKAQVVFGA